MKQEEDRFVKCTTCGCAVYREEAKDVRYTGLYGDGFDHEHYCKAHQKKYNEIWFGHNCVRFYARMEVDRNGEPIGYIKNPKKK